ARRRHRGGAPAGGGHWLLLGGGGSDRPRAGRGTPAEGGGERLRFPVRPSRRRGGGLCLLRPHPAHPGELRPPADRRRPGVGRALIAATEAAVRDAGGTALYAETSSRDQYAPTRGFYRAAGYAVAAEFPDFYAPGDGKIVFAKRLTER